jgi:hypothetical protein
MGIPSTYLMRGGLGSVRSINSETASLIDRPVALLNSSTILDASGESAMVIRRGG